MNSLKITLDPGAKMPERAHKWDAGADLFCREKTKVPYAESVVIDTGVHVEIPAGYVGLVMSKSGLAAKYSIESGAGVIDAGYTGSIKVKLYNYGRSSYTLEQGDKIAQLLILPIQTPGLEQVDSLEETERGSNGFGSTGR